MPMQYEHGVYVPIDADVLAEACLRVPGPDDDRILMCFTTTEHDNAADGITILAMADSFDRLAGRAAAAGLHTRVDVWRWEKEDGSASSTRTVRRYAYAHDDGSAPGNDDHSTGGLIVLDVPPSAIRRLSLESMESLKEGIARMQAALDASRPAPGA